MKNSVFLLLLLGSVAIAADKICVQNFTSDNGMIPCHSHPKMFAWAIPGAPTTREICTRAYDAKYCEMAGEFLWIQDLDGRRVCALNHITFMGDPCTTRPKSYAYILARPASELE